MVPGGGFEPPTRGFSVHCSTPELPGHGSGDCIASGRGVLDVGRGYVQREMLEKSVYACALPFDLLARFLELFRRVSRHRIGAAQPAAQIDIGTAARTERAVAGLAWFLADRTGHLRLLVLAPIAQRMRTWRAFGVCAIACAKAQDRVSSDFPRAFPRAFPGACIFGGLARSPRPLRWFVPGPAPWHRARVAPSSCARPGGVAGPLSGAHHA